MADSDRKIADCRDYPSENNCQLTIAGPEEDVLDAAVMHAKAHHGHTEPDQDLREQIRKGLKAE
jgi:predicted small metal-binding protein